MMFRTLPLFFSVLLLQGCDGALEGVSSEKAAPIERVAHFSKNSIEVDDGFVLSFDGRIVRYDLIRNQRGVFDRYIIESSMSQMGLEGAIFSEFARKGYVRKVRQDKADRYIVNYVIKGDAPWSADFRPWSEDGAKTRLVITRRIEEQ
ncbi:hypothetical protein H7683_19935 [Ectopseudomonas mendocina]|uniref:hypothetical protein n=1 Tax=Ectopseudomonas mendocina TaxID=300 RepID=UPI001ADFE6AD|nr:hypothetical protein [Pseudomonas mendocina]QTN45232.1 hypothetical protein H7683_19935 [Pseudomonas mendocina]